MKILLTGAAGFIGSHTAEELLSRGHSVMGVDNFNDYYCPERKKANVREVQGHAQAGSFAFQEGDICDRPFVERLFSEHKFDGVVNLAAMAGVRASQERPQLYCDVNLNGAVNLMEACRESQPANFIQASTSSAYGDSAEVPFSETERCDRPLSPYAASKRASEMMAYTYHHLYGLNFTVLRFFTVYGPRNRPDMMAHKLLDNIFLGNPCKLYANGEMWRDWTFVKDIARGVASALEKPLGYEVINLGRGEMIKLADFVSLAEELSGKKSELIAAEKMDADVYRTFSDVGKARELIGYQPQVSVREGLSQLVEWYKAQVLPQATK